MHPRLTARTARQTQVVKGLEDTQSLQVVQARRVRRQRVLGTLQDAATCSANPKLAGFLVLRVRGTLDVHELNFDLWMEGTNGFAGLFSGRQTPKTHLQLESVERQDLRRGAGEGAKRRRAELNQKLRAAGNCRRHRLTSAAELQYDGVTYGVTIVYSHVVLRVAKGHRGGRERERRRRTEWVRRERNE